MESRPARPARTTWNGKVTTHWVDCRFCGDGQPAATSDSRERHVLQGGQACDIRSRRTLYTIYICGTCGTSGRGRDIRILTPWLRASERSKCSGVCLNGKHSCDCKCQGRCHGAGVCRCSEERAQ